MAHPRTLSCTRTRRWWHRAQVWIAVGVAGRQLIGLVQLRQTLEWVDQPQRDLQPNEVDGIAIHFVVPVLREQAYVSATVSWFARLLRRLPCSSLSVVTTAREDREREHVLDVVVAAGVDPAALARIPQLSSAVQAALVSAARPDHCINRSTAEAVLNRFPSTAEVVAAELAQSSYAGLSIRHVHYEGDGRKAAQVNHAVAGLPERSEVGYVAVYDVDSRPSPALIERTLAFAADQRATTSQWPAVLQQSARFTTSGTHPQGWQRAVCRGAALLQTLWTLRREIPSFRRYAWAGRGSRSCAGMAAAARGLAQTVGHGLLVRVEVFRASGGLPVYTVLDDFPFGYRLSVDGIDVQPVPYTTLAPGPEEVRELIAQGQRWFHNYLDYPRCAENARAQGHGTRWTRFVGLAVGGYRGATWLLRSPGIAASLGLLVGRAPWPARTAAAVALGAGVVVPVWMLARAAGRTLSLPQLGREVGELVLANLLSSAGPVAAIVERVRVGAPGGALSPKTSFRTAEPEAATS